MKRFLILTLLAFLPGCASIPEGSGVEVHTNLKGVPVSVTIGK